MENRKRETSKSMQDATGRDSVFGIGRLSWSTLKFVAEVSIGRCWLCQCPRCPRVLHDKFQPNKEVPRLLCRSTDFPYHKQISCIWLVVVLTLTRPTGGLWSIPSLTYLRDVAHTTARPHGSLWPIPQSNFMAGYASVHIHQSSNTKTGICIFCHHSWWNLALWKICKVVNCYVT